MRFLSEKRDVSTSDGRQHMHASSRESERFAYIFITIASISDFKISSPALFPRGQRVKKKPYNEALFIEFLEYIFRKLRLF